MGFLKKMFGEGLGHSGSPEEMGIASEKYIRHNANELENIEPQTADGPLWAVFQTDTEGVGGKKADTVTAMELFLSEHPESKNELAKLSTADARRRIAEIKKGGNSIEQAA